MSEQIGFHAMPRSPHLKHNYCGYMELSLQSLCPDISSSQVGKVFIEGIEQRWRALGNQTLMVIPSFRQEAQRVVVELKASETPVEPVYSSDSDTGYLPQPDLSMGLSRASNRFERGH